MESTKIGNVFEFVRNGVSIKQNSELNGVPITRIETIWNGTIDSNRFGYADIQEEELGRFENYLLQEGDILMSHINSLKHLAKSALFKNNNQKIIHGMNLLCLRPNKNILDQSFAKYYFESKNFKSQILKISNQSVNQCSFSAGELKKLEFPLPSLKTQQKIAAILDEADKLRQLDKKLIQKYEALSQSLFLEMFGDPVKNNKTWKTDKLGSICGVGSSKRVFVKDLVEDGIPFYRGKEIGKLSTGKSIGSELFITKKHYEKLKDESGVPRIGDLLMPSICPDGRILRVSDSEPFYFKDGRVLWVKVNNIKLNSFYLQSCLKEIFKSDYLNIASGTTFAELKIFALKKINLPTPPLELQNLFEERINSIEIQKSMVKKEIKNSEELFNSLLQKAFKGELV